jgi:hypothetical protein
MARVRVPESVPKCRAPNVQAVGVRLSTGVEPVDELPDRSKALLERLRARARALTEARPMSPDRYRRATTPFQPPARSF